MKPPVIDHVFKPVGNGQCVALVKAHGFADYSGDAYQWKKYINSDIGWPGYAVLLDEGPYDHLAFIIEIVEDGYRIVEQNYSGLYVVTYRTIPFNYSKIIGFIKKTAS